MKHRLIAALDTADRAQALNWAEAVSPSCGLLKLGLEFFAAHGPQGVASLGQRPVFLDLKLFDIPNTVAGAVRALGAVRPAMLTLHASGGAAMVAAARAARDQATPGTKLLAVTVLTSFDEAGMHQVGVAGGVPDQVMRLARVALAAGADGLVCSAHEVAALRAEFGSAPILVVPGIRPAGVAVHDQARVMTPAQAVQAGADYIVVGRPITEAADPGGMAAAIAAEAA